MKIDDGGPAFPRPASIDPTSGTLPDGDRLVRDQAGLSLRDYFAAKALAGLLAGGAIRIIDHALEAKLGPDMSLGRNAEIKRYVCKDAYEWADAMLAQRTKETT